jgi:hypothetical protein
MSAIAIPIAIKPYSIEVSGRSSMQFTLGLSPGRIPNRTFLLKR